MPNTDITIIFAHRAYKFDIRLLKSKNMKIKVKTVKEISDDDWINYLDPHKRYIPADTELMAEIMLRTHGCPILRIVYDERVYTVSPHCCEFLGF